MQPQPCCCSPKNPTTDEQQQQHLQCPSSFPSFPFASPYSIQLGFMKSMYECLEHGGVGLMESPTGTGKTVSIICSALQWLLDHRKQQQEQQQQKSCKEQQEDDLPDWLMDGHASTSGTKPGDLPEQSRAELARTRHAAGGAGRGGACGGGVAKDAAGDGGGKGWVDILKTRGTVSQPASAGARAGGGAEGELDEFCLVNTGCEGGEAGSGGRGRRRGASSAALTDSSEGEGPAGGGAPAAARPWERLPAAAAAAARKTQVIFCSRTHSQLSQFVGELRRTQLPQQVSLVALAGRKVLCIHKPVLQGGPASLVNERCLELQQSKQRGRQQGQRQRPRTEARPGGGGGGAAAAGRPAPRACGCPHLPAVGQGPSWESFSDDVLGAPLDVEDLVRSGASRGVCPYYGARQLVPEADLLLLPYSAVLSQEARESLGVQLEGAVLVFDEAHNLVDAVNSSHSCSVSAAQLRTALRHLRGYLERFAARLAPRNAQQLQLLMRVLTALLRLLQPPGPGSGAVAGAAAGTAAYTTQPQAPAVAPRGCSAPSHRAADAGGAAGTAGVAQPCDAPAAAAGTPAAAAPPAAAAEGRVVTTNDLAFECGIHSVNMLQLLAWAKEAKLVNKVVGYTQSQEVDTGPLTRAEEEPELEEEPGGVGGRGGRCSSLSCMHACTSFLAALTNPDADGRVIVSPPPPSGPRRKGEAEPAQGEAAAGLKYVLLNAASHFSKVLYKARAVVLASGTLSPIQGLVQQLFPGLPQASVRHYSCGHIVPRESLVALVAGRGPTGLPLCLRHQDRGRPEVMDEVGRLLLNICNVAPDGIVVFAPSFSHLELLVSRWTSTGLLTSLEAKKQVYKEPRGSAQVEAVLQQYASSIAAARARRAMQQQQAAPAQVQAQGQTGALLLSVVGAKLSEGINFGDELGRCVVVLGMPYPNPTDPELRERMAFLDQQGTAFTGQQYYEDLCMKAVNQCIGRVIRHKGDYAAVVLADARYLGSQTQQQQQGKRPIDKLPGWMHPSLVEEALGFGQVVGRLSKFFKSKQGSDGSAVPAAAV